MKPRVILVRDGDDTQVMLKTETIQTLLDDSYNGGYKDGYNAALAEVYKNEKRGDAK